jgi:hypothetical protein
MIAKWWKTAGGVLVEERGRKRIGPAKGAIKIAAYRPTGGFHGWLWLRTLERASGPSQRRKQS